VAERGSERQKAFAKLTLLVGREEPVQHHEPVERGPMLHLDALERGTPWSGFYVWACSGSLPCARRPERTCHSEARAYTCSSWRERVRARTVRASCGATWP
jgi:hypothetical protein